jgi:hypothetical protein
VVDAGAAATCITNCRDCRITLTGRATKLVIGWPAHLTPSFATCFTDDTTICPPPQPAEGCRDCTVTVSEPVTTGTAEVINCQSVTVHLNHRIPTIQVPDSPTFSFFAFPPPSLRFRVRSLPNRWHR